MAGKKKMVIPFDYNKTSTLEHLREASIDQVSSLFERYGTGVSHVNHLVISVITKNLLKFKLENSDILEEGFLKIARW